MITFYKALGINRNFSETWGSIAVVNILESDNDEAALNISKALRLDNKCISARYANSLLKRRVDNEMEADSIINEILSERSVISDVLYSELINNMRS